MEGPQREAFNFLLKISLDMQALVSKGDWEQITLLEKQRQETMEKCFSTPIAETDQFFVTQIIERTLDINQQLAAMSDSARQLLAASISQKNKNKFACEAYSETLSR
ncbi:MAG: flagellar protein FliT [Gammaproteobacteria bacterium]